PSRHCIGSRFVRHNDHAGLPLLPQDHHRPRHGPRRASAGTDGRSFHEPGGSPRSNIFLFGHGTDLSRTTNIPAALEKNIVIALAPDWSIGGSQNLLAELRYADLVDNTQWGDVLTPGLLLQMVTKNPARILGLTGTLGELDPGRKADVVVIGGS